MPDNDEQPQAATCSLPGRHWDAGPGPWPGGRRPSPPCATGFLPPGARPLPGLARVAPGHVTRLHLGHGEWVMAAPAAAMRRAELLRLAQELAWQARPAVRDAGVPLVARVPDRALGRGLGSAAVLFAGGRAVLCCPAGLISPHVTAALGAVADRIWTLPGTGHGPVITVETAGHDEIAAVSRLHPVSATVSRDGGAVRIRVCANLLDPGLAEAVTRLWGAQFRPVPVHPLPHPRRSRRLPRR